MASRYGGYFIVSALTLTCLICTPAPTFAQKAEKWRPKDGLYIEAGTEFTGPCEGAAPFLIELSKKSVKISESETCKITKFTDTAPGALRLNMICNESEIDGDDDPGQDYKEIMTLRRVDEKSFFMRMSSKGKFARPEWRVDLCPSSLADK